MVNMFSELIKQKYKFLLFNCLLDDNIRHLFIRLMALLVFGTFFGGLLEKLVKVKESDFVIDKTTIDDELHEL